MNEFFLLSLRISGIKNIEKPIEIPFYKKTIKDDFNPKQYRVKGIYGENGSGKTAIMTAVKIMTRILLDRNYLLDSVNQKLLVENINKKTRKGFIDVTFYADFLSGPQVCHYRLSFEIKKDDWVYITGEIFEEKNGKYSQNAYKPVFETRAGTLLYFGDDILYASCKEKTQNLLEHRSFASFSNEIETGDYRYTNRSWRQLFTLVIFAANIYVGIDGEDDHWNYACRNMHSRNEKEVFHETESLSVYTRASSAGRDREEVMIPKSQLECYRERVNRLYSFIRIFKTDLKGVEVEAKEYGEFYLCRRIMVYDGYELDEEYESRGIRKLMGLFEALDAACRGSIVFIDELDSNINDVYLDKLIEYFAYYGKGQLCFTAHNLSPMSVLRDSKLAISFISSINTVHTWASNGNQNPEHAYRDGFIEDSPFNVDATDFLGILGDADE